MASILQTVQRPGRVAGKVALITGGTGGIGMAIAMRLGQEGARLVLTDINPEHGLASVQMLAASGIEAIFLQHDVRDESSWKQVVEQACARFGCLHVLVNNAGIALPPPESLELTSFDDWRRIMSVNLDGVFLGCREGVRAMKEGGGSIINIGSVAAYVGTPGGSAMRPTSGTRSPSRTPSRASRRSSSRRRGWAFRGKKVPGSTTASAGGW